MGRGFYLARARQLARPLGSPAGASGLRGRDAKVRPHLCFMLQRVTRRDVAAAALDSEAQTTTLPTARVHQGDAYLLADDLAPGRVDLVCTSPPYWGLRTYGFEYSDKPLARHFERGQTIHEPPGYAQFCADGGVLGLEPSPDWYVAHLVEIFAKLRPAMNRSGNLWINLGDTYFARWSSIRKHGRQGLGVDERLRRRVPSGGYRHDKQLLLLPARFAIAMQEDGWILRNDLIWAKPNVAPRPEQDRLRLSHEHFFHFVLRRPSARPRYYYDLDEVEDGAFDVVQVQPEYASTSHSATFPRRLISPRIRSSCPEGGTVLDPFCGVGTTLVEALQLDRSAVGFELSPPYAALASKNAAKAQRAARRRIRQRLTQ